MLQWGAMAPAADRYRLRLHPIQRVLWTVLLVGCVLFLVPGAFAVGVDVPYRLLSVVGTALGVAGLHVVLGPSVVVRENGLRLQQRWPLRRDIPWYRIFQIEVVPGAWVLVAELNSGEQVQLPCVERVDELYASIEAHRQRLDV